jgi:multiple sugar transport system substrate-binding protein
METEQDADILFFDDSEYCSLINDSALTSLVPYIHDDEQQTRDFALPLVSFADLFFYNIDILKTANYDRPPKTRAEFSALARTIAGPESAFRGKIYSLGLGLAEPSGLRRDIYPWIWADGADITSSNTNEAPVLTRSVTDTIAFFSNLYREGLLAPGSFEKSGTERLAEFAEGKIAMMSGSARDIAFLRNYTGGINFGITGIPRTAHGKNGLGLSKIYAGISGDCTQPDEAWLFLSFIAGKNKIIAESLGAVPGSPSADFPGEYIIEDSMYSKAWDIFEGADIIEHYNDEPSGRLINSIIKENLK